MIDEEEYEDADEETPEPRHLFSGVLTPSDADVIKLHCVLIGVLGHLHPLRSEAYGGKKP